ncbi:MAG: PhoPQ-activated protein PqaA family protein, partial [Candidatus Sumerlaeota bacterium]|nr:PhoPQ-activated protein PqaA family protein [Candidatus Sumerlaeota bacterium]
SGAAVRKIEIEFTSLVWAGETWRNRAALYIPAKRPAAYRDAAIVCAAGGDQKGLAFASTGLAAITLIDVPGKHYGVAAAGALMSYGNEQYLKTGDPRWLGSPWLARIFMRAITAAQAIPEFEARRFIVTGASKWGGGSWVAAGADDRIVGALPLSWNIGNVEKALNLKAQRMGIDYKAGKPEAKGPGFLPTSEQLAFVTSPLGRQSLPYTDPYQFRDRLASKPILYMDGTNDPLFHVDADTVFLPEMRGDIRVTLLPNTGHGPTSPWVGIASKMWLAHIFAGRDVPRIEVAEEARGGEVVVTTTVSSRTKVKTVSLWSAEDKTRVFLEAKWTSAAMRSLGEGRHQATLPVPAEGSVGYIVAVEDEDPATVPGVISTGFHEWPHPAR